MWCDRTKNRYYFAAMTHVAPAPHHLTTPPPGYIKPSAIATTAVAAAIIVKFSDMCYATLGRQAASAHFSRIAILR